MTRTTTTTSVATAITQRLKADRSVVAACILGSFARNDVDAFSDLDILAVTDEPRGKRPRERLSVPHRIGGHPVQLRMVTREQLRIWADRRTLFAAHLAREAHVVFDRRHDLRRLRRAFRGNTPVAESAEGLRRRLNVYADLTWCRGHYLVCLADLYALGRSGAMLALAQQGVFEFRRREVFVRYEEAWPDLSYASCRLRALEPFYMRVRRGFEYPLPFSARDADDEAMRARDACRALLESIP